MTEKTYLMILLPLGAETKIDGADKGMVALGIITDHAIWNKDSNGGYW
jgi:hypothetical protein